jgi:DNA adenine methylase
MIKSALKKKKKNLSSWIISNFPEQYEEMTYLEPFGGEISVALNKKTSKVESINDIDSNLITVYRALRDEPKEFIRRLSLCKYCEDTFVRSLKKNKFNDYLDQAINEFILNRMSQNGLKKTFAKSQNSESWTKTLKELLILTERIKEVYIFNKPAIEVLEVFNASDTLVYCDPPYLHEAKVSKSVYSSEMTTDDHIELSRILNSYDGKVLISGCMSPLYKRIYKEWNVEKNKTEKSEVLFKNF